MNKAGRQHLSFAGLIFRAVTLFYEYNTFPLYSSYFPPNFRHFNWNSPCNFLHCLPSPYQHLFDIKNGTKSFSSWCHGYKHSVRTVFLANAHTSFQKTKNFGLYPAFLNWKMEAVKTLSHFLSVTCNCCTFCMFLDNMQTIFKSPPHFSLQKILLNIYVYIFKN